MGIIDARSIFGIRAIRFQKRLEIELHLEDWEEGKDYDRLGLDEETYSIIGIEVPHVTIPVRPGRNMSSIVEVAARNQLLKQRGHNSARVFQERLIQGLTAQGDESAIPTDEVE